MKIPKPNLVVESTYRKSYTAKIVQNTGKEYNKSRLKGII